MDPRFQELLHEYKLEVYRAQHDRQNLEEITAACLDITEDVLQKKYKYHFHQLPDANRAEIINMINNYTREAILPPVVESLVGRYVRLERRFDALAGLMEKILEALSRQAEPTGSASSTVGEGS